jgi:single-strand DNA-binding protein
MSSLNRVLLLGNCTRDSEIRYTPGGTAILSFGLAVNRKYRDAKQEMVEEVTFVDVDLWGQQGEVAQEFLLKGKQVFVEGRLKFDQWDDKETGQKRSRLKVVAERVQFPEPRSSSRQAGPEPQQPKPEAESPKTPSDSDENVPF